MRRAYWVVTLVLASAATCADAGPPFLTDDPVPTDTGHWEIYGYAAGEGRRSDLDQEVGVDLNYGAAKNVQLTATVPLSFTHNAIDGWHGGTGDLELGVKYRFVNDEKSGFSAAIFPRMILPTSNHSRGGKTRLLLPLWLERNFLRGTSLFGGGGYEFNPGVGNRNFWQAAIGLTHDLNKNVSLGGELAWQQPDLVGASNQTRVGVGATFKQSQHYSLLVSAGPTWADHRTGYHFYFALGVDF